MNDAERRAQARHSWPVQRFRLGEEPGDDLSGMTTVEQRLMLVEELSARAWALTGQPMPAYQRSEIPVRLCRRR